MPQDSIKPKMNTTTSQPHLQSSNEQVYLPPFPLPIPSLPFPFPPLLPLFQKTGN